LSGAVAIDAVDAGRRQRANTADRGGLADGALHGEELGDAERVRLAIRPAIGEQGQDRASKDSFAGRRPDMDRPAGQPVGDQVQAMGFGVVDCGAEQSVCLRQGFVFPGFRQRRRQIGDRGRSLC
jgi:hypothetical protein